MCQISLSPQAARFFRRLPVEIQERVRAKFKDVALDPFRFLEHYEGDGHKLRIGEYRALVDVDQVRKMIFVRVFDKRGRIYK